jgi:hypothetical protein
LNGLTKYTGDLRQTFERPALEWEIGKFNPNWNNMHFRGREIKIFWHCPEDERPAID